MLKEGDLVLCTVTQIAGTSVFVKIEGDGEGTIVTSEIAPGRIRNIRDYVVPNKKIVCKVLKIDNSGNINLSLRRVSAKEKKEVSDNYDKERTALSILKSVLKEKADEVAEKIKKENSLYGFLQNCKVNPKEIEKYTGKQEASQICKILSEKKEKQKEVKKEFKLSSNKPEGIKIVKDILSLCKNNCEITYLAAGRYTIKIKSDNYKEANQKINSIMEKIEQEAKKEKAQFEIKEK